MRKLKSPVPPPSTGKPEVIHANKPIHAPTIDPNYDFTGVIRERLPYWVLKAAKHGAVQNHVVVGRIECISCRRLMWTCDKNLEDLCEEDEYLEHQRNRDMDVARQTRQSQMPVVNPFAEPEEGPTGDLIIRR